ncbi:MAG: dihydrofolate reductase [Rhodospirillaceae bacterium]
MSVLLSIAVAVAENGIIGRNNALPWHLPDDLKWFKRVTLGKPVIMGRKTFESIGRPLPGRPNIVVTSTPGWSAEGVSVARSLDDAVRQAEPLAGSANEIVVIGGARLFAEALVRADLLYLTEVHMHPAGDVSFPPFDRTAWQETERTPGAPAEDGAQTHTFVVLRRKHSLTATVE